MPLPIISSNSPSAGAISWTTFGLLYDGVPYVIPASSTSRKFVWWRRGDGAGGNAVPDGLLENPWGGLPAGWSIDASRGPSGGYALRGTPGADALAILRSSPQSNGGATTPVLPGQLWRVSFVYRTSADAAGLPDNWKPRLADQSGRLLAAPGLSRNTEWTPVSFDYRVPSTGVTGLNLNMILSTMTAGAIVFSEFNVRRVDASAASVESADTLPALGAEDLLLFINRNGIGALAPATEVVEGSLIASGSIIADAIAANQIDALHLRTNAVTADAIAANAVLAENIAAGAITTEKLSIGSLSGDWVANGSFEDGTQGWMLISANTSGTADVITGAASAGARALRLSRSSGSQNLGVRQAPEFWIPVTALGGRRWYISCRAGAPSTAASTFVFRAFWFAADKATQIGYDDIASNATIGNAWQTFEGQLVPPSGASYLAIAMYNTTAGSTFYVDEIAAQEVIVSAQIGDGQVRAEHIVANAITANHIAANTIAANSGIIANLAIGNAQIANLDGAKITADSVEGNRLKAKTVHGDAIIAGTMLTEKLAVGNFTNLVDDPNFEQPFGSAWRRAEGSGDYSIIPTTGAPGRAIRVDKTAGAVTRADNSLVFTVTPGEEFLITARIQNQMNGQVFVGVRWAGENGELLSQARQGYATAGWGDFTSTFKAPEGAFKGQVQIGGYSTAAGTAWFSKVKVLRRATAEILVDGAVTSRSIATNAVTADSIAANSIIAEHVRANAITTAKIATNAVTTNELAAGAVNAGILAANAVTASAIAANAITTIKIAANAVTATEIAANAVRADNIAADAITAKHTITGATVRTAATGARTEMTASGIRQYDTNGDVLVQLGHGIATGLSVRDPEGGGQIALANLVLGMKNWRQDWTFGITRGPNANVYGPWSNPKDTDRGVFKASSPTGRFLVFTTITAPDFNQSNFTVSMQCGFYTNPNLGPTGGLAGYRAWAPTKAAGEYTYVGMQIVVLDPNVVYDVRPVVQGKWFYGYDGPITGTGLSIVVIPM